MRAARVNVLFVLTLSLVSGLRAPEVARAAGQNASPSATELVERSERQITGDTTQSRMTMTVRKGGSTRELKLRSWLKGRDLALVKVLAPAKEKDQGNLRIRLDLWQYLPNIERVVRIPPSLMLQSWMGSDFSNDDLVRGSDLVRDYTHALGEKKREEGVELQEVVLTPKPDAPIRWGKVVLQVRLPESVPVRREFYAESGELVKWMEGSEIRTFGKRTLPTRLVMRTRKRPEDSTAVVYDELTFDEPLADAFFSQQTLKKAAR